MSRSGLDTSCRGSCWRGSAGRSATTAVTRTRRARRSPERRGRGWRTSPAPRARCRSVSAAPPATSTTRCVATCRIRRSARTIPTTAVELAALVLIKDKGAPAGQPIEAYAVYVREYNGSGPAAEAYAARVLADAHTYQGAGTVAFGPSCGAALGTPLVPGTKAKILPSGDAAAPADAPVVVQQMIAAGNRIDHFAYSYGGAHGDPAQTMNQTNPNPAAVPGAEENGGPGYDCSSATSYVLWGGGLGQSLLGGGVLVSGDLESVGLPGPGRWVTIYANAGHAYIEVAGIYLDTAAGLGNPPNPPADRPALEHRRHRTSRVRRAASARALTDGSPFGWRVPLRSRRPLRHTVPVRPNAISDAEVRHRFCAPASHRRRGREGRRGPGLTRWGGAAARASARRGGRPDADPAGHRMLAPRRLARVGREVAFGRHCDGAAQAGVRTKAVAPSRGGARSDLDDRESTQCVCWPARTTRSASAVAGAGRRRHRTWVHAKPQLRADRERGRATDDAVASRDWRDARLLRFGARDLRMSESGAAARSAASRGAYTSHRKSRYSGPAVTTTNSPTAL